MNNKVTGSEFEPAVINSFEFRPDTNFQQFRFLNIKLVNY